MREAAPARDPADAVPPWSTSARPRLVAQAEEGEKEDAESTGLPYRELDHEQGRSWRRPSISQSPARPLFLLLALRPSGTNLLSLGVAQWTQGRAGGNEPQLSVE